MRHDLYCIVTLSVAVPGAVALKIAPTFWLSYRIASAMTAQSSSFGPPLPPEKQNVSPVNASASQIRRAGPVSSSVCEAKTKHGVTYTGGQGGGEGG